MQRLYALSQSLPHPETVDEYRAGIEEVRESFPAQSETIELHYSGDLNAPHRWDPDDAISIRHHSAVRWVQKPTLVEGAVSFSTELTGDAVLVSKTAAEARRGRLATFTVGSGIETIGSILPRLSGDSLWTLDDPADVVAKQFEIDGNSLSVSFDWPEGAGDPVGMSINVWGHVDTDGLAEDEDDADALGISLIRQQVTFTE